MDKARAVVDCGVDDRIESYLREAHRLAWEEGLSFLAYLIEMAMVECREARAPEAVPSVAHRRSPTLPDALVI